MVNKLSSQEYIDIIYHNTILPLELCEKLYLIFIPSLLKLNYN